MSIEQTVRDFFAAFSANSPTDVSHYITPNATVSGGMLPQTMPAMEAFKLIEAVRAAMPDFKIVIRNVQVQGNQATVTAQLTGTHTAPLHFALPGAPTMPPVSPTGKKVAINDKFIITVQGDKVASMQVDSPADGGLPVLLAQLGVALPR